MVAMINNVLLRGYVAMSDLKARLSEERGQDLIEYALLGGGIAVALVIGLVLFEDAVEAMVDGIATCIDFEVTDGAVGPCP